MPPLSLYLPFAALAWRPFLDPIALHGYWLALLPPLVFVIALVYKTLKSPSLDGLWSATLRLTGYILVLIVAAAAVLWGVVEMV